MGLGVVRLQLDGPLAVANRIVRFAQPVCEKTQTVVGRSVFRFGFDNLFEAGASVFVKLHIAESDAKVEACVGKIGVEVNSLAIGINGVVKFALLIKLV